MDTIISVTIIVLFFYLVWRYVMKTRSRAGVIELDGQSFNYSIGDDLSYYYTAETTFHGINISLPKQFPHVYLDGHSADGLVGPRYFFDKGDRISLEGDFDKHFQAFVPKGYEDFALSILSPDVMQTLMDKAGQYDVELFGNHLRIITAKNIFNKQDREQDILQVASVVLGEVAHRMKSWSDSNSAEAGKMMLRLQDDQSLKLRGRYFRTSTIAALIGFGLFSLTFYGLAYYVYRHSDHHEGVWLIFGAGMLMFPGAFIYTLIANHRTRFKQR